MFPKFTGRNLGICDDCSQSPGPDVQRRRDAAFTVKPEPPHEIKCKPSDENLRPSTGPVCAIAEKKYKNLYTFWVVVYLKCMIKWNVKAD